ncbi:MAG TPA: DNA polymerase I, partial [Rhizobiales bacterium]|nr:DNA polymerase I [Hyphomicrobiales bacterium]
SDKDLMQLVSETVTLYDSMKDREIGPDVVREKFGVTPDKVVEVQALAGDSVDNIPGVPGIGVKTGALLINEYGSLEELLARAGEIKQPKRRQNLIEFAGQARLSHRLVVLDRHVPVETGLEQFAVRKPDPEKLIGFLKALEFNSLTSRIARELGVNTSPVKALEVETDGWTKPEPAGSGDEDKRESTDIAAIPVDPDAYETVTRQDDLSRWIDEAFAAGVVSVDTETDSLDAMKARLVGISLATAPGRACYIPLQHRASDGLALDGPAIEQIPIDDALEKLKPLLEAPGVLKIAQNMKYDHHIFRRNGIDVGPFDDTMLLSYALDSGLGGHGMDELSKRHLHHAPIPFKQIAGTGKSAKTFDLVPVPDATRYAGEDADVTLRLWHVLKPRLAREQRASVYETLERPLVTVLAQMEAEGILVDRAGLARLSGDFALAAEALEKKAHELAGEKFNPGSPKQLGEVLFGKMGLDGGRKTATGAWSTDSKVLEDLARNGVELAQTV